MRKILSTLDIIGADEDEAAANMARAIAFKHALDQAKKKEKEAPAASKPKSLNPWGMTDGAFIATILIVGASPILGVAWLYGKLKK